MNACLQTRTRLKVSFVFLLMAWLAPTFAQAQRSAYDAVDPMIGTGPDGHTFPGATVPFGMVQLSPDTQVNDFRHSYAWAAGYRYTDTTILGFSATHFSGAGHSDLGDFLVQPLAGPALSANDPRLEPGEIDKPGSGYRSRFSHATEKAQPGFYAVTLADTGVRAEMTATTRVGVQRYTFPAGKPAHLLMDLRSSIYNYPGKVLWSRVRLRADGTVTGMRETRGWAPGRQLYFAMRFSQPLTGHQLLDREPLPVVYKGFKTPGDSPADTQAIEGRGLIAVFDFGAMKQPLVVEMALSPVSETNALANLAAETPGFDFDAIHAAARKAWEQALAVLDLKADRATRTNLYTALYHALLAPSVAMDVDGSYRGPDNQVHRAVGFNFVSSLSLWDTYRAEQPLMTILEPPKRTSDLVRSMLASQHESPFGMLPVWQFQGIETWCMIGYHAVPEIADAILKDVPGFDRNQALDAMVATATYAPYGHLGEYMRLGYVPMDGGAQGSHDESVSQTIEYAFDDWTIAQAARKLGRIDVARQFEKRAENWKNVFNPAIGFSQPRFANGSFREPFNPAKAGAGSGFTEGNAWQYSWYQPQDEAGLIRLLGGDATLVARLDAMFDAKVNPADYKDVEDMAGMIGQYVHGNEPSHHLAYLYVYAGEPWRTQERLAQIVASQYKPAPDGLVGNDDLGQMSAWLLFTSLGFYPVAPGSNQYVIGRPFVDEATVHLPNGKQFRVVAEGLSAEHPYVASVLLNGKPLAATYLRHEQIMGGGELRFVMRAEPNKAWGSTSAARPFSMSGW